MLPRRTFSRAGSTMVAAVLGAGVFVFAGCTSGGGSAGGSGGSTASGGSGSVTPGSCNPDPLETNLAPLFNGNSVDVYDCQILTYTAKYKEPDAMIFKAIIYVESRFQYDAYGCKGNTTCCPKLGWSGEECGCLGAMQTGPGCNSTTGLGLLSNGHPDLVTDPKASGWSNSVFNPVINIQLGISHVAYNRAQVKKQFPGCTEDQYTMMAIGNYNSYGSTKSCTQYNTTYDNAVLDAYRKYSTASGWPAHAY